MTQLPKAKSSQKATRERTLVQQKLTDLKTSIAEQAQDAIELGRLKQEVGNLQLRMTTRQAAMKELEKIVTDLHRCFGLKCPDLGNIAREILETIGKEPRNYTGSSGI